MAVHKVPQDVEADDKFLGPLSFKQFLFFGAFSISAYLSFLTLTRVWPLSPLFIVAMILFGVMAFPWSKEQPTELFLGSRIRFFFIPRKRIWDQTGVKDLVTITVPKREAHVYTDGLSQGEVRNRLSALASMVDSRGWAVKNANGKTAAVTSDRLVSATPLMPDDHATVVASTPDVLDETANEAVVVTNKLDQSENAHKTATLKLVEDARNRAATTSALQDDQTAQPAATPKTTTQNPKTGQQQDFWFMHQNNQPTTTIAPGSPAATKPQTTAAPTPDPQLDENALLEQVHKKQARDALQSHPSHEKTIFPAGQQPSSPQPPAKTQPKQQAQAAMTTDTKPDILNLAKNNDFNVETIARQANKKKDLDDGEVVISLH